MLTSILYTIPFLFAIFCIISTLATRKPSQPTIRRALLIYLVDYAILLFTYVASMYDELNLYILTRPLFVLSLMSLFPLYYINIRLTTLDKKFKPSYYWIFAPALILAAATFVIIFNMSPSEFETAQLYESTRNKDLLTPAIKALYIVDITLVAVIIIELVAMILRSFMAVAKYKRDISNYYSNEHDKAKGLVIEITFIAILGVITVLELFFATKELHQSNIYLLVFTTLMMLLPTMILTFRSQTRDFTIQEFVRDISSDERNLMSKIHLPRPRKNVADLSASQPQSASTSSNAKTPAPPSSSTAESGGEDMGAEEVSSSAECYNDKQTVEVNISYIAERIVEVVETKKLYLKSDLRITDVCDILLTNRTYISQAINTHLGGNFSDFINRYRLEEAKRLLAQRSNDNYTIESLAEQAGFSTAASMNRTFRKIETLTPHQYRQNSIRSTME